MLPTATKIAVLYNPPNSTHLAILQNLLSKSSGAGVEVIPSTLKPHDELDALFSRLTTERMDAVQLLPDPAVSETLRDRLAALALAQKLPLFSNSETATDTGALLSYGGPIYKMLSRMGYYVRRILDGADAGDLPVEQPTEVILVVNLKTAKARGVEVPAALLARADRMIE